MSPTNITNGHVKPESKSGSKRHGKRKVSGKTKRHCKFDMIKKLNIIKLIDNEIVASFL